MKEELFQHLLANDVDLPTSYVVAESDDESRAGSAYFAFFMLLIAVGSALTFWLFY